MTRKAYRVYRVVPSAGGAVSFMETDWFGNPNSLFETVEDAERTLSYFPYHLEEEEFVLLPVYFWIQ